MGSAVITDLSTEVIFLIIKYLTHNELLQLRRTCIFFRDNCNLLLRDRVKSLYFSDDYAKDEIMEGIQKLFPNVSQFCFFHKSFAYSIFQWQLIPLLQRFPNVNSLCFFGENTRHSFGSRGDFISKILILLPNLEQLIVSEWRCRLSGAREIYTKFVNSHLKTIAFRECIGVSCEFLQYLPLSVIKVSYSAHGYMQDCTEGNIYKKFNIPSGHILKDLTLKLKSLRSVSIVLLEVFHKFKCLESLYLSVPDLRDFAGINYTSNLRSIRLHIRRVGSILQFKNIKPITSVRRVRVKASEGHKVDELLKIFPNTTDLIIVSSPQKYYTITTEMCDVLLYTLQKLETFTLKDTSMKTPKLVQRYAAANGATKFFTETTCKAVNLIFLKSLKKFVPPRTRYGTFPSNLRSYLLHVAMENSFNSLLRNNDGERNPTKFLLYVNSMGQKPFIQPSSYISVFEMCNNKDFQNHKNHIIKAMCACSACCIAQKFERN